MFFLQFSVFSAISSVNEYSAWPTDVSTLDECLSGSNWLFFNKICLIFRYTECIIKQIFGDFSICNHLSKTVFGFTRSVALYVLASAHQERSAICACLCTVEMSSNHWTTVVWMFANKNISNCNMIINKNVLSIFLNKNVSIFNVINNIPFFYIRWMS